jgi:hypothetical protein
MNNLLDTVKPAPKLAFWPHLEEGEDLPDGIIGATIVLLGHLRRNAVWKEAD